MKFKRLLPFLLLTVAAISTLGVASIIIKRTSSSADKIANAQAEEFSDKIDRLCSNNLCFQSLSEAKMYADSVQLLGIKPLRKKEVKKQYDDYCADYFDSFSSQCDNVNLISIVKDYMSLIDSLNGALAKPAKRIIACVNYKDGNYKTNIDERTSSYITIVANKIIDDADWTNAENMIYDDYPNMSPCCSLLYQNEIAILNSYKDLHRKFEENYNRALLLLKPVNSSECNDCNEITGDISFLKNQHPFQQIVSLVL